MELKHFGVRTAKAEIVACTFLKVRVGHPGSTQRTSLKVSGTRDENKSIRILFRETSWPLYCAQAAIFKSGASACGFIKIHFAVPKVICHSLNITHINIERKLNASLEIRSSMISFVALNRLRETGDSSLQNPERNGCRPFFRLVGYRGVGDEFHVLSFPQDHTRGAVLIILREFIDYCADHSLKSKTVCCRNT